MLGGEHVRRRSIGSFIEASPCVRMEKRKHSGVQKFKGQDDLYDSNKKTHIMEKPSIASTSSQFGGERMIKAEPTCSIIVALLKRITQGQINITRDSRTSLEIKQ